MKSSVPYFWLGTLALSFTMAASLQAASAQTPAVSDKPMQMAQCPRSGPTLSMEYLYWKIEEEQLYFTTRLNATASAPEVVNLTLENQRFGYTSGFRAGLGYDLPGDRFDVFLAWTRIHPHTSKHLASNNTAESEEALIPISLIGLTNTDLPGAESLRSKWHLAFDMLDLELGRKYFVGKRLCLRPHIGLKGGWIDQTQKVYVSGSQVQLDSTGQRVPMDSDITRKNDFQGIGPRLGVDMRFGLGSQFGLFGNVSGALLYGPFDLKTKIYLTQTETGNGPKQLVLKNSHNHVSPTVQMLLGADWSRCLYQKWWIRFGAAYEVQFWWDQMGSNNNEEQTYFKNYNSGGSLTMHGLTLQARFEF